MSKFLKFLRGGISAISDKEEKGSWMTEIDSGFKELAGIFVAVSIFL